MNWENLFLIWERHKGISLGIFIGLLLGILILVFGFWKTFFVILCCFIGAVIGKSIDNRKNLDVWVNKIFKNK
ncbi:MAG: DUF2273 domain-containing protein [Syntrophomonadaceae bacterium]|jgi:uncharacterized membrane protein|nr:DUF2273 domain-containing protein [Syntrophomonadaceae bacterium]